MAHLKCLRCDFKTFSIADLVGHNARAHRYLYHKDGGPPCTNSRAIHINAQGDCVGMECMGHSMIPREVK